MFRTSIILKDMKHELDINRLERSILSGESTYHSVANFSHGPNTVGSETSYKLQNKNTKGVDIRFGRVLFAGEYFRSHVNRGANTSHCSCVRRNYCAYPKICYLALIGRVHEEIVRFDVSVDEVIIMQMFSAEELVIS